MFTCNSSAYIMRMYHLFIPVFLWCPHCIGCDCFLQPAPLLCQKPPGSTKHARMSVPANRINNLVDLNLVKENCRGIQGISFWCWRHLNLGLPSRWSMEVLKLEWVVVTTTMMIMIMVMVIRMVMMVMIILLMIWWWWYAIYMLETSRPESNSFKMSVCKVVILAIHVLTQMCDLYSSKTEEKRKRGERGERGRVQREWRKRREGREDKEEGRERLERGERWERK